MPKLRPFTYYQQSEVIGYHFFCPGCKSAHSVYTAPHGVENKGPVWGFNGSMDKPTFSPSLLMSAVPAHDEWPGIPRCHLFIRDGQIQFLDDCEHALKGQTVEIPEWDDSRWGTQ